MNTITDIVETRCIHRGFWTSAVTLLLGLVICLGWPAHRAMAQTAGEGSITGIVTDTTGAVIPKAKVTAIDNATKITTVRYSTSAGYFNVSPLPVGQYSVEVSAPGFKSFLQENVTLDALQSVNITAVLSVGAESTTITVTTAPPQLQTDNATMGMVMENENYSNLPILMNGQQRDPTAFGLLAPAAQGANNGGRLPIVGGTGSYLGQLYVDGMPAETVTQQGDNRLVSLTMDLDAVDQFQIVTSTPPAEYIGAGAENYTMKSGGLKYHGQVSDFVRNTVFDTWGFTAPWSQVKNALGVVSYAPKPVEHQNELSVSAGGVVPFTAHKMFFYAAYLKFHYRNIRGPSLYTIPTALMRSGDFTELAESEGYPTGNPGTGQTGEGTNNNPFLYDPTSTSCTGSTCTRQPFAVTKNLTATYNIIPSNAISPIAQYMQKFLPTPTNTGVLFNNYLGSTPGGYDNHVLNWRVDYDLSSKHRIFSEGLMGTENYVNNYGSPYISSDTGVPTPYMGGDLAHIYPKDYVVGDTYTISPNLVNQLKGSFTRFFQNIHDPTQDVPGWGLAAAGITNLPPAGQAITEFPGASFATTTGFGNAQQTWTSNGSSISTQLTTPNNYAFTDNLKWLKGKHSFTFGFTYEFQDDNNANPATYSSVLDLAYNAYSTANFASGSNGLNTGTAYDSTGACVTSSTPPCWTGPSGYSYASYLLGAVGGTPSLGLQPVSELAGRFKPAAPYAEDIYKVTRKLTLDIGMRWDYLPPYHEAQNRWTFMNPTLTNTLTGTPGMLEFAGTWGGAGSSIGQKTPVTTWWGNWGPRVSMAYELNSKTVFRAGGAIVYTQAGGVGGRGGAAGGTGQTGFNMTAIGPAEATTTAAAGPSFYLNNSAYFAAGGYDTANSITYSGPTLNNTSLFGPGFAYPAAPTPGPLAQQLNTGFYVCPLSGIGPNGAACTPGKMVTASSVAVADSYISGRAPEIVMWNAGFQRALTPNLTLAVDYMANESHFIINSGTNGSNARGYWVNQLNPLYYAVLGSVASSTGTPLLNAAATPANVAKLQMYFPSAVSSTVVTNFENAAAASNGSSATIEQMLVAFPQYSGVSDTWGTNVGNFTYESLQVTLNQRVSKGLTFNFNYTFSKNIGDDGSFRSGFPILSNALSQGTKNWRQDRYDRSWTDVSIPNNIHAYGVWDVPLATGNQNALVKEILGGWKFSSIYIYSEGTPALVTWSGTTASTYPGQGQANPDVNPNYGKASARINGKYGSGVGGYNVCNLGISPIGSNSCHAVQYWDPTAFQAPVNISSTSTAQYLIGNAARSRPLQLRGPNSWDWDAGLHKTFPIHKNVVFQFEANAIDVWNHVNFGGPSGSWSAGSTAFGGITGASNNRDFQFAGHLKF